MCFLALQRFAERANELAGIEFRPQQGRLPDGHPESIERIRIEGYRVSLDVTGRKTATTPFEAKFCLRYGVANAVLYGRVRTQAFQPGWVTKPEIASFMERIELVEDPELTKRFPRQRSARAIITTRKGERLEHLQLHRRGDREEPLTDAELDDKFMELSAPVIGELAAKDTLQQIRRLDALSSAQLLGLGIVRELQSATADSSR